MKTITQTESIKLSQLYLGNNNLKDANLGEMVNIINSSKRHVIDIERIIFTNGNEFGPKTQQALINLLNLKNEYLN